MLRCRAAEISFDKTQEAKSLFECAGERRRTPVREQVYPLCLPKSLFLGSKERHMNGARDPNAYKTSYAGVEADSNFPTRRSLQNYRRMLLRQTQQEVAFIGRHLGRRKMRVLECCSGNGRLLIGLAIRGMLESGLGVEISRSRVAFAKQWAADLGLKQIHFVHADVLEFNDFPAHTFDLGLCIQGALNILRGAKASAPTEVLQKMGKALAPHGCILLEIDEMSKRKEQMLALANGKLRLWMPLPRENRFAYALHDLEYSFKTRILHHKKIFIRRDGLADQGRLDVLGFYSKRELLKNLNRWGFCKTYLYEDFRDGIFIGGASERVVGLSGGRGWCGLISPSKGGRRQALKNGHSGWKAWMGTTSSS